MFNRSHAVAAVSGTCPKCGSTEVVADTCPRCRVRVSNYQAYLAIRDGGALARRAWFSRLRPLRTLRRPAPSTDRRSIYEELILGRIYRELRYPATARGVYLVLLGFDLTPAGPASALRLTVNPENAQVAESVRVALNRAQPFPTPPNGGGGKPYHVSLVLTVNI